VKVTVDDKNKDDTHTVRWYFGGKELTKYRDVFEGNIPSNLLVPGEYVIKMVVADNVAPENTVTEKKTLTVKKQGGGSSLGDSPLLLAIPAAGVAEASKGSLGFLVILVLVFSLLFRGRVKAWIN